jgi:hypothetical protein
MTDTVTQPLSGTKYSATVPDTLDLADHARSALNGMGGSIDPKLVTMYGLIVFCSPKPHQSHWASAETICDPKFGESFPLMRLMCGSDQYVELEARFREAMVSRIQDGLYWDLYTPERPWRNNYSPTHYGKGRDEDFCTLPGTARMVRALLVWRELGDESPATEEAIRSLIRGLRRILVCKDDYGYYPEKGGWGEPGAYPRSGWLNTDEAQDEVEGGEGAITCIQSHQIYAAAHWYSQSGDPEALDLAARLSRYCMLPRFWGGVPDPDSPRERPPGTRAPRLPDPPFTAGHELGHWFSHFHARAIALRGLLEFALATGDERIAEFVRRSYEFTLTRGIPRMGWINTYPANHNFMEGCALGDLLALGIRMTEAGLGDYWDDVDAVARNHLVEMQFLRADDLRAVSEQFKDAEWDKPNALPNELSFDDVFERSIGTFSGHSLPTSIPKPFGIHCCTGNATQGLYYAWEGIVRKTGEKAVVNLFLNRASRLVDVDSYLPYEGKVVVRNKAAQRVAIRIPSWVDVRQLRAEVSGVPCELDWTGRYVNFEGLQAGAAITLTFPVVEKELRYTVNAHTQWEQEYTCLFRGSTLVDISPRDNAATSYPLYQRSHMRASEAPIRQVERFVANRLVHNW